MQRPDLPFPPTRPEEHLLLQPDGLVDAITELLARASDGKKLLPGHFEEDAFEEFGGVEDGLAWAVGLYVAGDAHACGWWVGL